MKEVFLEKSGASPSQPANCSSLSRTLIQQKFAGEEGGLAPAVLVMVFSRSNRGGRLVSQ